MCILCGRREFALMQQHHRNARRYGHTALASILAQRRRTRPDWVSAVNPLRAPPPPPPFLAGLWRPAAVHASKQKGDASGIDGPGTDLCTQSSLPIAIVASLTVPQRSIRTIHSLAGPLRSSPPWSLQHLVAPWARLDTRPPLLPANASATSEMVRVLIHDVQRPKRPWPRATLCEIGNGPGGHHDTHKRADDRHESEPPVRTAPHWALGATQQYDALRDRGGNDGVSVDTWARRFAVVARAFASDPSGSLFDTKQWLVDTAIYAAYKATDVARIRASNTRPPAISLVPAHSASVLVATSGPMRPWTSFPVSASALTTHARRVPSGAIVPPLSIDSRRWPARATRF